MLSQRFYRQSTYKTLKEGRDTDTMTLCMIAPEFIPVWGGTGSYTVELIKHLPKNVDIHVVTLKRSISGMSNSDLTSNSLDSIFDRPIETHYISTSKETFFYNLWFQATCLRKIPQLQRQYKFDIIHSHHCHMPDLFLQLLNQIRVPTVATVHSTIALIAKVNRLSGVPFEHMEQSEKYTLLFYPVLRFLERLYAKCVPRFIAVSNLCRKEIMKKLRVKAERISVIHNGVDTKLFSPPESDEMEKKYSRPTIVYMGRLIAKKGIHVLIKAMPEVIRNRPDAHFLFIGGGNIPVYVKMFEKMRIPKENFSFVGHVGYFARPRFLREATVFVNPSFFEHCSLSILEAMSCNTAVIASDVEGNREIITSGKNGVLTPVFNDKKLTESIISLLEDENLNKEIGREARRTVERSFSSEKCAKETYNVYKQILGSEY